jgi:hypothetical protein
MVEIKDALTGKNNLKTQVHKDIKGQVAEVIADKLGFDATPNGSFAKQIATADGKPVFVRVDFVVTLTDPFEAKEVAAKEPKEKEVIVVPSIF